jgi:3-methyl-2-oxobutanoate hydroxymethyltransferase
MGIKKFSINDKPIVCLTAYDYKTACIVDNYCDVVLVGDSVGMALYGDKTTTNVTLDVMIRHGQSVRKGLKKSYMVVDMPKNTYKNKIQAFKNAKKIITQTKCDAVKLEGGKKIINIVNYLIRKKIKVVGHIGLLPQSINNPKDYRVLGKEKKDRNKIYLDFKYLENSGVDFIILESVKKKLADKICKESRIPIIGIGASNNCHGQILVTEDLLGYFNLTPKFVQKYVNLNKIIKNSIKKYKNDVRSKKFPSIKNLYN